MQFNDYCNILILQSFYCEHIIVKIRFEDLSLSKFCQDWL